MVGGGQGAFIGAVHRKAMALDGQFEMVAGALSSTPEKSRASGRELGLRDDRNHADWRTLLADELKRDVSERAQLVCIVTPNFLHHPVAMAFVQAGFNVACDKPLVQTGAQARELAQAVVKSGVVFGVTYNYTGYPMVRQAREMIRAGTLGTLRKVHVEYHQGWLSTAEETSGNKQAEWRADPSRGGPGGAIGDIGSHAENLVATVTGLKLERLCADLGTLVPGRAVDDDAAVLMHFEGGARGILSASQVMAGVENGLRLRVSGTQGTLEWHQEEPNRLLHSPIDGPPRVLTRNAPWLCEAARRASRIPPGHPEGFLEAFANVYLGIAAAVRARETGQPADPIDADFPGIEAGVRGVEFLEAVLASAKSETKWTPLR
ncbi:Gfo/Idh/MocA family protein [Ramlibacter humi]|uniref:Gfo/Idh/MocA family oxidoreductase n=1 Tax=Ramlibacter humi TaxID=2530451 RepID=A0A4Z0BIM9_9BURK|nr:Gfo/Idh/MocA family oxidoreductase [Ramlibacter humi]TFY97758.1 Gfo/Idh/MocA family oxidoreductase [Ramlibacter humi]